MIKYQVRSKELIDVVNEIKSQRLIMSAYFQRNLVWRLIHKQEFIQTILLGYPFPQIFIAKGSLDIENMQTTSCIVDGQQRMNSIMEFVQDQFRVGDRLYSEFSNDEKADFLKYQIPIIDLDIANDSQEIIEIFKRLNRTFYSLSTIEKLASEFSATEFMLVAKFLVNEFKISSDSDEEEIPLQNDPNIPKGFFEWARTAQVRNYNKLILENEIFTNYEISRKVHLMFTLNSMATVLGDFYNRNELAMRYLEEYKNDFPQKNDVIDKLNFSAQKYSRLKFKKGSYWVNKANAFSLMTFFAINRDMLSNIDDKHIKAKLLSVEDNLNPIYQLAAKEAVNNKRERLIRNTFLTNWILNDKPVNFIPPEF